MQNGNTTQFVESRTFQRRIRRYVHAPVHRFAATVPPELAHLCGEELRGLGFGELKISDAGVEFSGKLPVCYSANLQLRTAGRVLCLLQSFRSGAVEELFKKANQIPWELWLNSEIPLLIKAFVEYSRIEHEGLVVRTAQEAIQKRFHMYHIKAPSENPRSASDREINPAVLEMEQRVFIHLRNDRCQISFDTSGAHLHLRGYRLQHAGAPLRETLAAALLMKAGWKGETPLVDGMCGAGTVPIEAVLVARRLPPGANRSFLFQQFPSYQDRTWAFLRRKAVESSLAACPAPVIAIDSDSRALSVARMNAERAGVEKEIGWLCKDFFDFTPQDQGLPPGLVFINPPYGKRLSGGEQGLYERLGAHLRHHFIGWQAVVLAPERGLAVSLHLNSMRFWNLTHGGLPIVAAMARV